MSDHRRPEIATTPDARRGAGRAYVTVLSTDDYAPGVLALNRSLSRVRSAYPLVTLVGSSVSDSTKQILSRSGIECVLSPQEITLPKEIEQINQGAGHDYWNHTLDKLSIFSLCQFSKLVYLDSDMIVIKNIDELFDAEHMSAVVASGSVPGNEDYVTLNSGLMVVEPSADLTERLVELIPAAAKRKMSDPDAEGVGDQDVIHEMHPDWKHQAGLRLPETYNMFVTHMDFYIKKLGYSWGGANGIRVLHFTGREKPWMSGHLGKLRRCASLLRAGRWNASAAYALHAVLLLGAGGAFDGQAAQR